VAILILTEVLVTLMGELTLTEFPASYPVPVTDTTRSPTGVDGGTLNEYWNSPFDPDLTEVGNPGTEFEESPNEIVTVELGVKPPPTTTACSVLA